MNNVENPTISEIKTWAYSNDDWPHQEWDLFLSWKPEISLFIELATDHKCPKRGFFRHMLYYVVGKTIQDDFDQNGDLLILGYLNKAQGIKHGDIKAWVKATECLLKDTKSYKYDDWRGAALANYVFT